MDSDLPAYDQVTEQERVAASQPSVWVPEPAAGDRLLDLCFVLDCTGSMGSYIASATQNIELIMNEIVSSEKLSSPACLRVALVAYRDHPPQDNSYVTKTFQFTSDVTVIQTALKSLYASGGGDGPEAVTAALKESCDGLQWREGAAKMVTLIADAPPHGIGEYGDGFSDGSPDGVDPLQLVRHMATKGITLFVVACEPALSGYSFSTDFFRGLVTISSGAMVPLTNAAHLAHVIVGSALEQMDMERLIQEVGNAVVERLQSGAQSVDDVARDLHTSLSLRNENTKHLLVENIYRESPEAQQNVQVWASSSSLAEAKRTVQKVPGSRFTDAYNQRRMGSSYHRSSYYSPPVPARPSEPKVVTPPASPPRKVVSSFKAFSAPTMSMAGTGLGSDSPAAEDKKKTPPGSPTFGGTSAFGLRSPAANSPKKAVADDIDADAILNGVELRMGGISLEQASKIARSVAFRSAR